MNIGTAAERSGLPRKTIRYYEDIDLVRPRRRKNGYRDFSERDVQCLCIPQHARSMGFSVAECRSLLSLCDDRALSSAQAKRIAREKIAEIDKKLARLDALRQMLAALACDGALAPDC